MATLAFFFALTGGAMAGTKYLTATDPINAGDLAGSTYGNPVIAAGAITSGKFAATAKAPDADTLDAMDSTEFLSGYVGGASEPNPSVPTGGQATASSWCPLGMRAIGGGFFPIPTDGDSALRAVVAAFAINDSTGAAGFTVTMANEGGSEESFHVQVRCASGGS